MAHFAHGGDVRAMALDLGCEVSDLLDFSANLNPLGPPECLRQVVSRHLSEVVHYPDPQCSALCAAIARVRLVAQGRIVCGNGSTELLFAVPAVLSVKRAIIPVPSYSDYATAARRSGLVVKQIVYPVETGIDWEKIEAELTDDDLVIIGQPGNPVGKLFDVEALRRIAQQHPKTYFLIDEAFADFVEGYESVARLEFPNILVLCSMTKFYAIPGIRLGYLIADEGIAQKMRDYLPPWSVGNMAQAVGVAVLRETEYATQTRHVVTQLRENLQKNLEGLGCFRVFSSVANYLLVRIEKEGLDAQMLADKLLKHHRIPIRVCANYAGLDARYFRVAVRTEEENVKLVEALTKVFLTEGTACTGRAVGSTAGLGEPLRPNNKAIRQSRNKAIFQVIAKPVPAIMFQGTSSNAGKSVLTAAFCRILLQDGYRVAPFKAQNMSLNSYVTREGGEMGRAQVMQAQACRLDPDVRMNPILLKPNSETGSQVILNGKPVGNMDVEAYIRYKPQAFEVVQRAYDSLASEVDVMVLEGAGSPGEVNLKRHDIVNMAMADYAKAPVLIVGDIDRGGVFASFIGTLEVLSEKERARVAGFVVNRFRGRQELLADALAYVENHTGLPTFGVVPYLRDLGLPEEDSVSFKEIAETKAGSLLNKLDIAVIDLPHISNFTDIDALRIEPDVEVRIVRKPELLGIPDAVILPGSKNVIGDLQALKERGLAEAILKLAQAGHTRIVGLCGGFQMLGKTIEDPTGIESAKRMLSGLGLLPVETVLLPDKTLKAVHARHVKSGLPLRGYEIHHGATMACGGTVLAYGNEVAVVRDDGEPIGYASADGRIMGTYLHGFFDADTFRRWFIDDLRQQRGWPMLKAVQAIFDVEPALDRLATVVRASLDVKAIYKKMGLLG
jgi:cobyric acid synthase CobQ/L-threonine-O-3-phosphate decarboxylase